MNRRGAVAALLLSATVAAQPTYATESAIDPSSLQLSSCYARGLSDALRCGRIEQPLAADTGREGTISIHFAVIPAINPVHPKEAILAFAGGPGQSAFDAASTFEYALRYVRETRDILLVDQRGTGKSGVLQCDGMDLTEQFAFDESTADMAALIRKQTEVCREKLQVNLQHYTTLAAASDFEAVRLALGYQKLHLYGGSYGTRMAQQYMRQYPDAVLSATLDGVVAFNQSFAAMGLTSDASLDALYAYCEASPACRQQFPQARQQFEALLVQLERSPLQTQVRHPRTYQLIDLKLTRFKLQQALRFALYSNSTRALVPFAIDQASTGDYSALVGLMLAQDIADDLSIGVNSAVVCAEDWPFWTEQTRTEFGSSYLGAMWQLGAEAGCQVWQVKPASRNYLEPLATNTPVLLLSGGLDPVTPPSGAELAMAQMTNARHLIAPHATHIVATQSCAPQLISQFIAEKSAEALDSSCLEQDSRKPFMTNANGTAAPVATVQE
ncbi:MAG: alpha/beta fold hydrolase [Alkalimonas sp.]|nr:alpha/beta fold hydrolase [Alkalimonas sp.]